MALASPWSAARSICIYTYASDAYTYIWHWPALGSWSAARSGVGARAAPGHVRDVPAGARGLNLHHHWAAASAWCGPCRLMKEMKKK